MAGLRSFGFLLKWRAIDCVRLLLSAAVSIDMCFMLYSDLLIFSAGTETRRTAELYVLQGYLNVASALIKVIIMYTHILIIILNYVLLFDLC